MNLFKASLLVGVVFLILGVFLLSDSQNKLVELNKQLAEDSKQQLKISKERHIESLYSTYKSNIDTCREAARNAKKDENFIQENCIKPVNDSIVGQWLKEWGREDLLVTE